VWEFLCNGSVIILAAFFCLLLFIHIESLFLTELQDYYTELEALCDLIPKVFLEAEKNCVVIVLILISTRNQSTSSRYFYS